MCVGILFSAQNVLKNSKLRVTGFIIQIRNLIKDLLSLRKAEIEETLGGHGRKMEIRGQDSIYVQEGQSRSEPKCCSLGYEDLKCFFLWCVQEFSISTKGDNMQKA